MRVKLFTLRYSASLGGFDDTPLLDFTRDKEVVSFREHFFAVNDVPHLACVLSYQDAVVVSGQESSLAPSSRREERSRRQRSDPTANLSESDRVLWGTLRQWRTETARTEGVPPYVVLTNRQLEEIILKKPDSLTALGNLEGLGPAKIKRHGKAILTKLHGVDSREQPASSEGQEPEAVS